MSVKESVRGVLWNAEGRLRAGWRMALGVALYLAAFCAVLYGLAAVFGRLFDAWGLTTDNLSRAPRWAQLVVIWHTDFSYAMAYAAAGLAGALLARRWGSARSVGRPWLGAALGVGAAALLTAVALGFDCMRMEWPFGEPVWAVSQLVTAAVLILGKLSAEILTKRLLFDVCSRRIAGYAMVCAATFLLMGAWTSAAVAFNALLLGIVSCSLYERGGLAASAGLQIGLNLWLCLIFGWPGMTSSASPIYALYHVSDAWLTGGANGALNGWGLAILLMAAAIVLLRREILSLFRRKK